MQNNFLQLFIDEAYLAGTLQGFSTWVLLAFIGILIFTLSRGADWTIEGVVDIAGRTGLPRIVIGATIVSLGTTAPEAFVSVMAAWMGNPGLALGNGVGSIIADTGLIFGMTCLLARVPVNRYVLNRTGWVQVGVAVLLVSIAFFLKWQGKAEPSLGRGVGLLFLFLLGCYLAMTVYWSKKGGAMAMEGEDEQRISEHGLFFGIIRIAGGLLVVLASARLLVPIASMLAARFGVPDDVIAATMVAFGTSLPELMTAVAAVKKGHPEIMVGNVVGADVLNCLFVIGAAAAVRPLAIPVNFYIFHFPAMLIILFSFRIFIGFSSGKNHFRQWQGACLVLLYALYIAAQYAFNIKGAH